MSSDRRQNHGRSPSTRLDLLTSKPLSPKTYPEGDRPRGRLSYLTHSPELRAAIKKAQVILGEDVNAIDNRPLFFGQIAEPSSEALVIQVDYNTDDLEVLCALVDHIHGAGSCRYVGNDAVRN